MTRNTKALVFFKTKPAGLWFHRNDNPDEYDRLSFVLKARLREGKSHSFTTVLHVERTRTGSRLIATDGKRMHVVCIGTKIKNGNYRPLITKDTISLDDPVDGIVFPAWHKVVLENGEPSASVIPVWGKTKKQTAALTLVFKTFIAKTGEVVNLGYLEDLPKTDWDIYKEPGKRKAVMLKQQNAKEDAFAVMVPLDAA